MMLFEQTQVPDQALPVAEFRAHLQLGTGFPDDGFQDPVLIPILRAAIAAVEGDTSKVLLERRYQYVRTAWRDLGRVSLPVAPISSVLSFRITDMGGGETDIPPARFRLVQDGQRPEIISTGWALPTIPVGGTAELVFDAGFGPVWSDVPADLAQATLMLGAHYYDNRGAMVERGRALPDGVARLLSRHRVIRLFGGGA
ncbi:hypothetical protein GQ651_07265 [Alphaproteobacteria bacterium GH1-50]|uniref:PhiE125 gp8 family phage protein n=1 Tax=Kangsaoukella pontilimi TaxID=2691042 RepID=A0A7C9IHG1_9RHOB|nr:hypothetical protein [Kangsaoukella pontilimi]MXQ07642.1 hypothetical protein [Kangsaoukella pontilimi]